jgi:hypothetical protein
MKNETSLGDSNVYAVALANTFADIVPYTNGTFLLAFHHPLNKFHWYSGYILSPDQMAHFVRGCLNVLSNPHM